MKDWILGWRENGPLPVNIELWESFQSLDHILEWVICLSNIWKIGLSPWSNSDWCKSLILPQNIAQSLTDMDLIFIEEAFERLLLDYDRGTWSKPCQFNWSCKENAWTKLKFAASVDSLLNYGYPSMPWVSKPGVATYRTPTDGISQSTSVVWRRTGEIFKGNREFAALVGIPYEQLRDGKLAIYELMTEDSAVNFWEVGLTCVCNVFLS